MTPAADLGERLKAELLPDEEPSAPPTPTTVDRILDAAVVRIAEVGIERTTMSAIAAGAELSREWLYRHFPNRDAVVAAVLQRELRRFIDGLAEQAAGKADITTAAVDAFVFSVEFLRDQAVLEGLVDRDVKLVSDELRAQAGALVGVAVRTCAAYLVDLAAMEPSTATVVAETLTRLVGSTVVAPAAVLDLHDSAAIRDYAQRVVPAMLSIR